MPDDDMSLAETAEQIAASIPDSDFADGAAEPVAETVETVTESPAASAEGVGEEVAGEAQDQSDVEKAQETELALDPPPGLTAEEIEQFRSWPRAAQEVVARRERERQSEFSRGRDEIANQKKAFEQERQRLSQAADQFTSLASTIDPIIAEGQKTDWAALARDNPAEYVARKAAFDQRVQYLTAAFEQSQQIKADQMREHLKSEEQKLVSKFPDWADRSKAEAGMNTLRKGAVDVYGYKPEEVAAMSDHRIALMLRDALAYRADQAAKAKATVTAPTKRVVTAPRVVKPGAAKETDSATEKVSAIRKQLASTTSLREQAELIASIL